MAGAAEGGAPGDVTAGSERRHGEVQDRSNRPSIAADLSRVSDAASQPPHGAADPGFADPDIGVAVCNRTLTRRPGRAWWAGIVLSCLLLAHFAAAQAGLAPLDEPSPAGALDVAAYDWCLSIASGSLLLSGILLLVEAEWRCAVIRIAQTVALAAACAAGLIAAAGSPGALPVADGKTAAASDPASDAAMLAAILAVSAGFWAIGLLPDLAVLRDHAFGIGSNQARFYRWLGLGWRGSARQWQSWGQAYRATALLACFVAIGVQVDLGVRLAAAPVPGWRDAMLPVTLLIDAVLGGTGLVAAIVALLRGPLGLEAWIAPRHLDILARLLLVLGLVAFYCHAAGFFSTMLGGQPIEREASLRQLEGERAWAAWTVLFGALLPVQLLWFPAARRSIAMLGLVGLLAVIGVYGDHAMIRLAAAEPGESVDAASPTLFGAMGLVLLLLLLFVRTLPVIAITETRALASVGASGRAGPPRQPAIEPSGPHRGIVAVFAAREGLFAAVRRIRETDAAVALDAWGPVPIPEVSSAILPPAHPLRTVALLGAVIGGVGFVTLSLWFTAIPFGVGGRSTWPGLIVPAGAVASATGALALLLALAVRLLRSRQDSRTAAIPELRRAMQDRFVLLAETGEERFDIRWIERRLAALPSDAGRPLSLQRVRL